MMNECKAKLTFEGGDQVLRCEECGLELARMSGTGFGGQTWLKVSMKGFKDHAKAMRVEREQRSKAKG